MTFKRQWIDSTETMDRHCIYREKTLARHSIDTVFAGLSVEIDRSAVLVRWSSTPEAVVILRQPVMLRAAASVASLFHSVTVSQFCGGLRCCRSCRRLSLPELWQALTLCMRLPVSLEVVEAAVVLRQPVMRQGGADALPGALCRTALPLLEALVVARQPEMLEPQPARLPV